MEIGEEDIPAFDGTDEEQTTQEKEDLINKLNLELPLEREVVGGFLDKKALVGKTVDYIIKGLNLIDNQFKSGKKKKVLQLQDAHGENCLLDVGAENTNALMDKFGNIPSKWINQSVKIKYSKFEAVDRNGRTIEGVKWDLI